MNTHLRSPIPAFDLGTFLHESASVQREIATQVDNTCRSSGFLIIENHGVPQSIIDDIWDLSRAFFDLPIEQKLRCRSDNLNCPRGYFPIQSEALARSLGTDTPPDVKESFGCGPLNAPTTNLAIDEFDFHYGENVWPEDPQRFSRAWIDYYHEMEVLGANIMKLFAAALGLPLDYFHAFHDHHVSALRCINYPENTGPLLPDQKAAGEHSDYGTVTLLMPDREVHGLEIRLPEGIWVAAPLVENAYIVNIGDMMARWTNDRWVSTLHRVVTRPPAENETTPRRQSLAYFQNTNFDTQISCLPNCVSPGEQPLYRPVAAGQYLFERFTSAVEHRA